MKKNNIKCIKTIKAHSFRVKSLLLLRDHTIASCSYDKTIMIYNPNSNYKVEQVIQSNYINSMCQLEDGTIASCSKLGAVYIGEFAIENAHEQEVTKIISLPNNRIASCSFDKTIKIWNCTKPYSDTPIVVLEKQTEYVYSMIYIKERDLIAAGTGKSKIQFWSMLTYQCVSIIKGVECWNRNAIYQLDKDRLITGGYYKVFIINIDKCITEKICDIDEIGYVNCFMRMGNIVICGGDKGNFCFFDIESGKYKIKRKVHETDKKVNDLLRIDEHTFMSCSDDYTCKVWKYNL